MTALQRILSISLAVGQYGALAAAAVAQVQAEVGASGGDPGAQVSKKQLAVAYVLAAAHAGESVPFAAVQQIAAVVEMQASIAKMLGLFGKTPAPEASVAVPAVIGA